MDAEAPAIIRENQQKSLEQECIKKQYLPGEQEVCLGTFSFPCAQTEKLDYDDFTIAIVRAKLEKRGFRTDFKIVMDDHCKKTMLTFEHDPEQYKTSVKILRRQNGN